MVCDEKMRLMDEYAATTAALHEAASGLLGKKSAELQSALTATEAARTKCFNARLALSDHKTACAKCERVEALKRGQKP